LASSEAAVAGPPGAEIVKRKDRAATAIRARFMCAESRGILKIIQLLKRIVLSLSCVCVVASNAVAALRLDG
jgi:hypothetical protein